MKKLLLSIFMMVVAIGLANATEVSIATADVTWTAAAPKLTGSDSGFDFVADKLSGSSNPTQNATDKDVRVYAKGAFTINSTVGNMTKVVINISTAGLKRWSETNTVDVGTLTNDVAAKTITWEGNADSFTITVGEKAGIGTDGASKAGQLCFSSLDITYTGAAVAVAKPVITPAGGDVTTPQTVTITCETAGASIHYTLDGTAPSASSTTYTAPFEVTETTTVKAIAVKGSDVSSIATETFEFPTTLATIADFYALGTGANNKFVKFSCPLTVTYFGLANGTSTGRYLYVKDATGAAMQIYATTDFGTFANGDVIPAGLEGTVSVYGGQLQFNPDASSFGEITKGATVEPTVITVADANANSYLAHYVKFENVTFDTATKKIVSGEDMINYYIRFADATAVPTDGKAYDMVGIYTIYNGTKQIFPISFTESAGTGIENVEAADVVSTEYYSVLGQKLNAAEAGLNIVKETLSNGKVVVRKVMVK